jgi:hypothetical protein
VVIDHVIVPVVLFAMIPVTAIGVPIARAYARRIATAPPERVPAEVSDRLQRMEQAIDSIAIEVERISEGQRFTTKLLADRTAPPAVAPASTPPR